MSTAEAHARRYCRSIGADPDEIVWHNGVRAHVARWRCYPGAIIEKQMGIVK